MNGQLRQALCGVLATLASACALLPLVNTASWMVQAAVLVVVQAAAGVLLRRVRSPRFPTVAVQAVVSLLLLTAFSAGEEAVAGFLPGPDAFAEFGRLLDQGAGDIGRFVTPAPLTDGIRLILTGGVLVVGLLVDLLAVTLGSAAPAGLPLLALYSVAAGIGDGGTVRRLWFLCGAAGYLLLLLSEGQQRHLRWGRVFSERGRRPRVSRPVRAAGRTGHRIGAVALALSVAVPAVLPSLGDGLLDPGGDERQGENRNGTVTAVNPLVALQDSLNQPENRTALTYTTDAEQAGEMYLRIVALDRFDGSAWKPSEREIGAVPHRLPAPRGLSPAVGTRTVTTRMKVSGWYAQNWLPLPYPAEKVRIGGRWRFEPEGRTLVGDRGQTTRGAEYVVESLQVRPTARQLHEAPEPPEDLRQEYTKVPSSLPPVVRRTALRVTRGADSGYERARKLQEWFTSGAFRYDTTVRSGSGSAAVVNFLEQKEGFCVHFAFSMAAMARTLGLPARVAVGFAPGTEQIDGSMAVGLKDAHAWPELYFEGVGWTRFEPTPTRGTPPGHTRPDEEGPAESPGEELPGEDGGAATDPGRPDSCTAEDRGDPDCGAAPSGSDGDRDGMSATGIVAATTAALLVPAVLALPLLRRTLTRRRRLGGGSAGPLGAWHELQDTARDLGIVPDGSLTPRAAAARIARTGGLGPRGTAAVRRLALGVERALYAPGGREDGDAPDGSAADDVREVRAELRRAAPRLLRMRALLLPRSALQVPRAPWNRRPGERRLPQAE